MVQICSRYFFVVTPSYSYLEEKIDWDIGTTKVSINELYNFYNDAAFEIDKELIVYEEHVKVSSLQDYILELDGSQAEQIEQMLSLARQEEGSAANQLNMLVASDIAYLADETEYLLKVYEYVYPNECLSVEVVTVRDDESQQDMVIELLIKFPFDKKNECLNKAMMSKFMYMGAMFQYSENVEVGELMKSIANTLKSGVPYTNVLDGVEIISGFVGENTLVLKFEAV